MGIEMESLIEQLPIGLYVCDAPSGVIRFYNRKAVELWGREPRIGDSGERFCGSLKLFRGDGTPLPHAESPMAEFLGDGEPRTGEVMIERPDGTRITVQVTLTPLRDAEGRLRAAMNAFQDITDRKAAEEAVRSSEARYRAIVEDQPEMVCRFFPDGTLTFVNEAYRRFFGLRREEVLGKSYVPVVHPDDVPRVKALIASLSPTNRVVVIENRARRADGAMRWTQWVNQAIYDRAGRILEFQAAGRDVTSQKRAEEDAAKLAAVVAGAEDAIVSKTLDGTISSWNRAAESMFGFSAEEVIGKPITTIIPPERLSEEAEILRRIQLGIQIDHFETERLRKDGTRVSVSLTVSPVRDSNGRVIGASKIARDITERRRADEALQRSLRTLEVLYRLADRIGRADSRKDVTEAAVDAALSAARADRAAVLLFDHAGRMRFAASRGLSRAYRKAVDGHSPWTREARDPLPILVEDVVTDPGMASLRSVLEREGIRSLGFVPLVHQGRLLGKFMVYYDAPHRFSEDELRLTTTIAQHAGIGLSRVDSESEIENLLERERIARREADASRADAERANRAKDEFLAMLSHELRNPLSAIVNAVEVIAASGPPDPSPPVRMIRRQTQHLARLLDDLLDVARITSGRIELEREPLDLPSAVALAVEAQRHRTEAKGQRVTLTLPDEAVTVEGDPVRLQQVLGNLVNNASKYTPMGGSIQVKLTVEGGAAILRVRDDGVGIPNDRLESIFELFVQANPGIARTEGGLGIGLTLVRKVVELHGGEVRASSEGLGRGAEFTVRLPLARDSHRSAAHQRERVSGAPLRILVVEDHDDGREALVTILRKFGHAASGTATGREAIATAERESPDIVLVDIGLPDLDGYEVARTLRATLGAAVRLIALTGYGQPDDRARSSLAGFDLHLVKPVAPSRLQEIVARLAHPPAMA
jgi:PAS domain S-box-containing protein